ncbi:MAG: hypothetical protein R3C14_22560 [Caldilineaceae bacterium]
MSYWHEPRKPGPRGGCSSSEKNRDIFACIRYPDVDQSEAKYEIYGKIWIGDRKSEPWFSQGWIELWPKAPMLAADFQEARRLQLELLERLVLSVDYDLYKIVRADKKFVEAIEHPSKEYLARIYQHQDGKFEIHYLGWHTGRGGGWGRFPRFGTLTFASDLDSAREAAQLELEEFASQKL